MSIKAILKWDVIDGALAMGATIKQIIYILETKGIKVTERTLQRHIETEKEMSFSEYRDYLMGGTKVKLQQKAIQMGLGGNATMLIFSLKNLCGWADKVDSNNNVQGSIKIDSTDEQL